jgi:hypothetical protein
VRYTHRLTRWERLLKLLYFRLRDEWHDNGMVIALSLSVAWLLWLARELGLMP